MDIRDSQRIKEIRDNTAKMADAFTRIADALERMADHKTKPFIDDFFREPTAEERKAVAEYIESISIPTGVNVLDFMDESELPTTQNITEFQKLCGIKIDPDRMNTDCGWK